MFMILRPNSMGLLYGKERLGHYGRRRAPTSLRNRAGHLLSHSNTMPSGLEVSGLPAHESRIAEKGAESNGGTIQLHF